MVLNQLFTNKPSLELVNKLIALFGLKDITDKTEFSFLDMDRVNTLTTFRAIENEIRECYIPCKCKKYLPESNLDNKILINVLRQFLKAHGYDLDSREKFIKRTKYILYRITTHEEKIIINRVKRAVPLKEITITFD